MASLSTPILPEKHPRLRVNGEKNNYMPGISIGYHPPDASNCCIHFFQPADMITRQCAYVQKPKLQAEDLKHHDLSGMQAHSLI